MPKESQPTQQFVDIEEIRNGIVVLKNGSLRRVLLVSGINFELKSEEEKNAVLGAYQNFLNSLDFSLQIVVHSRKFNIEKYIKNVESRLEQEGHELIREQTTEYLNFIKSFVQDNAIMSKNFFVIVPYESISLKEAAGFLGNIPFLGNKKNAKKEAAKARETIAEKTIQLDQRTEAVINGLVSVGLRAIILDDEELIELFYNLYNPQSTEKKELKIAKQQ